MNDIMSFLSSLLGGGGNAPAPNMGQQARIGGMPPQVPMPPTRQQALEARAEPTRQQLEGYPGEMIQGYSDSGRRRDAPMPQQVPMPPQKPVSTGAVPGTGAVTGQVVGVNGKPLGATGPQTRGDAGPSAGAGVSTNIGPSSRIGPRASTHTVAKGDTLWDIAKRVLGDPRLYTEIAKLNNISNPDRINVGQTLRMPAGRK